MKQSWIVALRELKERVKARSFLVMAFIGPLLVLGMIYLLFSIGGQQKSHWKVLVVDPMGILENKIMTREDLSLSYSFANDYIEIEDFANGKRYQEFDAMLEVNEKVLSNKNAFLFYREKPSSKLSFSIRYQFERRLEEIVVQQLSDMSLEQFRQLKQPINLSFRNVYDPKDEASNLSGWVGFFFGAVIILFIFLFGMTILRSISREKSNRIVEVLLATIKPRELMLGKIIGIGLSAFIQFFIWVLFIGIGLYVMRESLFPDLLDPSNMNISQMTQEMKSLSMQEQYVSAKEYNEFVELVYSRIQFGNMLAYFALFFALGYLFYGTFFAALGAVSGSESDGQQFVIPLLIVLLLSLYAGNMAVQNPDHQLTTYFSMIPFTSPVVCLVKIAQGYPEGSVYQLYLSLIILLVSALLMLFISGRLYQNGILQFGHRLRLKHLFKWLKRA